MSYFIFFEFFRGGGFLINLKTKAMKTASKLAQLARANQNKQEKVQLTKDGKVVFIGTRESAERWMCENGETYSVEKWKPQSFQKTTSWASHQSSRLTWDSVPCTHRNPSQKSCRIP